MDDMNTTVIISHPEKEIMDEWKAIYDQYIPVIKPRHISGQEILDYILNQYPAEEDDSEKLKEVVRLSALGHAPYLPDGIIGDGSVMDIAAYRIKNEGAGAVLYENQMQEYKDKVREFRRYLKDAEDIPEEDFPIPVVVGVEKNSGYVFIEGSPALLDEITVLKGLNEKELNNIYLVAHYVQLLKKYKRMDLISEQE